MHLRKLAGARRVRTLHDSQNRAQTASPTDRGIPEQTPTREWPSRAALRVGRYTNLLMRDSTRYLRIFWTAVSFNFVVMPSSQTMTYVAGFDASIESTTPS